MNSKREYFQSVFDRAVESGVMKRHGMGHYYFVGATKKNTKLLVKTVFVLTEESVRDNPIVGVFSDRESIPVFYMND